MKGRLPPGMLWRFAGGLVLFPAMLLVPAGTVAYWEAWVYLAIVFGGAITQAVYLYLNDPALLERRLRGGEKHARQRVLVALGSVCYLLMFQLPGLDRRFGWSHVPVGAVVAADLVMVAAYVLFGLVLRENSFASRIVEVEQGQRVISTGPYAIVRHPMYVAIVAMALATPVALGSWWAIFAALPLVAVIVVRIVHEEQVLAQELEGYAEYRQATRYRLIPGIW